MPLLDLDNTLNKYLEIINKQILEPHIISRGVDDVTGIVTNSQINEDKLSVKHNAETEGEAILKIKQSANLFAEFTYSSSVKIDSANKASKLHTDDDGLIYYLHNDNDNDNDNDKKHYNLSSFDSAIASIPSNITDYSYFDYLVRFKILSYIKDNNHTNIKLDDLKKSITDNIGSIVNNIQTVNAKCNKMLDFLDYINKNNFNKFKATVDCLYYYYYIALLEYNNKFCKDNFTEYGVTEFSSSETLYNAIDTLSSYTSPLSNDITFTGTFTGTFTDKNITNILIAIFECLLRAEASRISGIPTILSSVTNTNTKLYKLITNLAKLCYTDASNKTIGLKNSSGEVGTYNGAVSPTVFLKLNNENNYISESPTDHTITNDTQYNNIVNMLTCENLLYKIRKDIATNSTILTKSVELATIKQIYTDISDLKNNTVTPFYNAIKSDIQDIPIDNFKGNNDGSPIDYIAYINTSLNNLHAELGKIIECYDKAVKLNTIQETINKQFDDISTVVTNTTIYTNDSISKNLTAISSYDKAYKENVDQYKIKNVELNNIVKSNLYNNIFLYVTIVILILICLGMIFINNHKQSLKTQYAIIVITFLLLYYIIYANISINVTEQFFEAPTQSIPKTKTEIKEISDDVYAYLVNLAGSNESYKASLDKEKKKYNTFAKSSNTKLTNLKMALNDEFINAAKSKELVKFLLLFTFIAIVTYIVYINVDDLITTFITFIVLFVIILCIYFYNTNLMTRVIHSSKYWNHQMIKK